MSTWKDGTYTLTATAYTTCGSSASDSVTITVDNVGCPSGSVIDREEELTGKTSISQLEVGLSDTCFTATPEFKLKIEGGGIEWEFEVKKKGSSYELKVKDKKTNEECKSTGLSISDLKTMGILDVDSGMDLLGYKSGDTCGLKEALKNNGSNSFTIKINKDDKYTNCSSPPDTCGGWYRYSP